MKVANIPVLSSVAIFFVRHPGYDICFFICRLMAITCVTWDTTFWRFAHLSSAKRLSAWGTKLELAKNQVSWTHICR